MENGKKIPSLLVQLIYVLFFLGHLAVKVAGDSLSSYPLEHEESIIIACGWSGNNSANGRTWVGDFDSEYFPLEPATKTSTIFTAAEQPPPYSASRFSRSQFTYVLNVTAGQKFIRLHFYSTSYSGFNSSKAFFSVKAVSYTLWSSFNASLTSENLVNTIFFKEFCINVEEDQNILNITFSSNTEYQDSYAFINGIEIVSVPLNLYFTAAGDPGFGFVGQVIPYSIRTSQTLETVYRINVGGTTLSPEESSMYRTWVMDNIYLTDATPSVLRSKNRSVVRYTQVRNYSASVVVYNTDRTMSINNELNKRYNLTWEFQVDSGFTYFLRLHFCEFQKEVTRVGDRVFQFYIAGQTADAQADVIAWSGGNGVSIYRDYAVIVGSKGNEIKHGLSVALHPAPKWRTKYYAILNGLEIFKLDNAGNLAQPNPEFSVSPP